MLVNIPYYQWRIQDLKKDGGGAFSCWILANLGDFLFGANKGGGVRACCPPPPCKKIKQGCILNKIENLHTVAYIDPSPQQA